MADAGPQQNSSRIAGAFAPLGTVLLALLIVAVIAAAAATALACANVYEPRHAGKDAVLRTLRAAAPRHALPSVHATSVDEAVAGAATVGYPLVVKPNALTSCALGVHVVHNERQLQRRLGTLLPLLYPHDGAREAWRGVVLQAYYGGPCIEARLYGVKTGDQDWRWDPVVYAAAPAEHAVSARAAMAPALRREVGALMAAAFPNMTAVAMDVRAPSLDALQRGDFAVLEVNGAFGVAHTWRGHDSLVVSAAAMGADLVRWFFPRVAMGARNIARGAVRVTPRIATEWEWAWAANAALKRVRTGFEPDAADLI